LAKNYKNDSIVSVDMHRVVVMAANAAMVRSQLVSLEFFIYIKYFRSHNSPGVDSFSNRNEYQVHFLDLTAAGA
jgi:hypothetical protein